MELNEYQNHTDETASYPKDTQLNSMVYVSLGCSGEAGEIANKVKKILRGDHELTDTVKSAILDEAGDVLWYIAQIARVLEVSLEDIAVHNIEKLRKRKAEGKIKGEGDHR